jgi:hypothetical protein
MSFFHLSFPFWLLLGLFGVIFSVSPIWAQPDPSEYKLVVDEDFVRIYEKWITQKNQGQVREIKVEFTVYADAQRILDCLQEENLINQWTKNHKSCKVTYQDKATWVVSILYPIPWPSKNKEGIILHSLKSFSPEGFFVALTSQDQPLYRLDPNASLLGKTEGFWTAVRQKTGAYLMTYQVPTQQDQVLPRWVTDPIVRNNLVNSMAALRDLAQSDISQ